MKEYKECCSTSGEHYKGCGEKKCHQEKGCTCSEDFLKLADEAWMEVLKEKIKAEIKKEKDCELNKLAEIIAKANCEKWKHKIGLKMKNEEYKNEIKEFFSSKD